MTVMSIPMNRHLPFSRPHSCSEVHPTSSCSPPESSCRCRWGDASSVRFQFLSFSVFPDFRASVEICDQPQSRFVTATFASPRDWHRTCCPHRHLVHTALARSAPARARDVARAHVVHAVSRSPCRPTSDQPALHANLGAWALPLVGALIARERYKSLKFLASVFGHATSHDGKDVDGHGASTPCHLP